MLIFILLSVKLSLLWLKSSKENDDTDIRVLGLAQDNARPKANIKIRPFISLRNKKDPLSIKKGNQVRNGVS